MVGSALASQTPWLVEPERKTCRSCGGTNLTTFLDLGTTPLADRLVRPNQFDEPDPEAPLTVALCEDCALVQIRETVAPEVLFGDDYPYFSSVSPALMAHTRANALELIESRRLDSNSKVVEVASNDGYMLANFAERGIPVLGIDPAKGPAEAAMKRGIRTLHTFFGRDLAWQLRGEGEMADVLIANNVLAHVWDLNGLVEGIGALLKDDGVAVIECPYLADLIAHCEFDTIYHQHLCYFSVTAAANLFRRHGLFLQDVRRVAIHGGSLRMYAGRQDQQSSAVTRLLAEEAAAGMGDPAYYEAFAGRVEAVRRGMRAILEELKESGARIVGYGAAAKATTLLSYCGIGLGDLEYIVDLNPYKHGRFMAGNRIPIVPASRLAEDRPDYCVLLAWNFASEIIRQQSAYVGAGGRFIVPVPVPEIVR
ncbi:MAG: class I SAM-dependent methyltransferase [Bryobacteraceae bacterium]